MFSRTREGDCQSTSDTRTGTGNGGGLMDGGFGESCRCQKELLATRSRARFCQGSFWAPGLEYPARRQNDC